MLTLNSLSFAFGDYDVFLGISASVPNDGKVGLVGPNGIGKTTLLRVIAGLAQPSTGSISLARGTRIGYLRQEAVEAFAGHQNGARRDADGVWPASRSWKTAWPSWKHAWRRTLRTRRLLEEYSHAQEAFEAAGGYDYETAHRPGALRSWLCAARIGTSRSACSRAARRPARCWRACCSKNPTC